MTRVGIFLGLGSPGIAELLADQMSLMVMDLEHGLNDEENTLSMLRAMSQVPYRWARISRPDQAGKMFDLGANGVLIPQIRSYEEAVRAVEQCKYPPYGKRGLGPGRASLYGYNIGHLVETEPQNEVWLQIETLGAVEQFHQIVSIEGINGFFIGPGDLSMELGIPGQFGHPKLGETIASIIEECKRFQKPWGIFCPSIEHAEGWIQRGASLVLVGSDALWLLNGINSLNGWKRKYSPK